MYIASTINPLTRSAMDIPVAVLCYGDARKFVLKPKCYEDLVHTVRNKFGLPIDAGLSFETSTLDICQGKNVEIDESAYGVMCNFLDEIKITLVAQKPNDERDLQHLGIAREVPSVSSFISLMTARKEEAAVEIHEDNPGSRKVNVEHLNTDINEENEENMKRNGDDDTDKSNCERAPAHVGQDDDDDDDDDRVIITSHKEQDNGDAPHHHEKRNAPASQEEVDEQRGIKATSKAIKVEHVDVPIKAGPMATSKFTSSRHNNLSVKAGKDTCTPKHREQHESEKPQLLSKDVYFTVIISGPLPSHEAEFKTRGKHLVRQVLAGACKNFALDFSRAHLVLIPDGGDSDNYLLCANDNTVSECGIRKNSKLLVYLDEDDEGDYEDDDS